MRPEATDNPLLTGPMLRSGTLVDHFRIMRMIGRGGMGEVYLARDTKLGRRAALKVINAEHLESKQALDAFLFEARTTARFSHPNIVMIHAVGEYRGRPYVALEYLEGQNLRERMLERRPSLGESLRIGLAIARALQEAHRNGVLHLDLKPENVVIPADGRVRVVDFGLARTFAVPDAEGPAPEPGASSAAAGWGTPAYVAPEQWRYEECSSATDVWALGIILYELVSGRLPYPQEPALDKGKAICGKEPAPRLDEAAEVSADVAALVAQCLRKDPKERPTASEVVDALESAVQGRRRSDAPEEESPFRGLLPFTQRHADLFFGRESEVSAFVERLRHQPVLTVVGPSGAGKSSFVQAGVVPRLLEQEAWLVLRIRPGVEPFYVLAERAHRALTGRRVHPEHHSTNPRRGSDDNVPPEPHAESSTTGGAIADASAVEELAASLREHPHQLAMTLRSLAEEHQTKVLLLVEQLEELFTMGNDERIRRSFVRAICSAADDPLEPVRVILTVRDDFLGRVAVGPEAREALTQVTVIQTLGPQALHEVLTRPLAAVGYEFEDPQLVEEMTDAVVGQPSSLPLLQFAAQLLWEQRDRKRRVLLRSAYEEMGGVEGALVQHADGVLDGMSTTELSLCRELLMRLVTPELTRKVVPKRRALAGLEDGVEEVFARLTQSRLISVKNPRGSATGPTLELVHESLIRRWDTLRRWLDESREDRAVVTEIVQAAELWDRRGRRPQELWTHDGLRDAMRAVDRGVVLPELGHEFLVAGQQRHRARTRRRRFSLAAVMGSLAAVSVGAISVAVLVADKEREARAQRDRAEMQRAEAIRSAASAAFEQERPLEARARLRSALEVADSPPARALWWQLRADPRQWSREVGSLVYDVDFSPTGGHVAVGCQDTSIHLIDTVTRGATILRGAGDQVYAVAYSPDGQSLASGTWSGEVALWQIGSHEPTVRLSASRAAIHAVDWSADGSTIAAGSSSGGIVVWDAASTDMRLELDLEDPVESVSLGPEGDFVAIGSHQGLQVHDVPSGRARWEHADGSVLYAVDVSADGRRVAGAGNDQIVRVYDAKKGTIQAELTGHRGTVKSVGFSPDDNLLVSGSYDQTVRVWDLTGKMGPRTFEGHDAGVEAVAWRPDGRALVSVGRDRTIRMWTLQAPNRLETDPGHNAGVYRVAFSPDGTMLASAGGDKTIRLWDVQTGDTVRTLQGHTAGVDAVAFAPDGRSLASSSVDLSVRLWDVQTGAERRVLSGHEGRVSAVAFDDDGRTLASASRDGSLRLFDVQEGTHLGTARAHTGGAYGVDFSPDGQQIVTGGSDGRVRLWQARPLTPLRDFTGHREGVHGVSFSPDGRYLASGASDKMVRIWHSATGQSRTLGPHGGRVYWLEFAPTGMRVGAPSSDGNATIWDLESKRKITLEGHQDEVNSLTFSPEGQLAATAADDGTVRVWDADTGAPLWHAPVLLPQPPRLFSHRGWTDLSSGREIDPRTEWADAVERRARMASVSADASVMCLRTHEGGLEVWDLRADKMVAELADFGARQVRAGRRACLARDERSVVVLDADDEPRSIALDHPPTAVGSSRDGFIVAAGAQAVEVSESGVVTSRLVIGPGATAIERIDHLVAVGFSDGNVQVLRVGEQTDTPVHVFEEVPASRAVRIAAGPPGTLFVGYANGVLGLWNIADGARLGQTRLHGRVIHLHVEQGRLVAATDLGRSVVWDLTPFYGDYCELLRQVWHEVPVVWQAGHAIVRPPPPQHRCMVKSDL